MESQSLVGANYLFSQVVPLGSASLGWAEPAETQVHLEATHTSICRFGEKNEIYKRVEDNMCELLSWSSSNLISSVEQVQRLPSHPHEDGAIFALTDSMQSLTGGLVEGYSLTGPPADRRNSSTWLDKLAGLWPLSKPSSVTPSEAKSTASDSPAEPMTMWPVCILPHPRPINTIERAQLFEDLLVASSSGPVALHGIGGAGKTQLAVKMAYWFLERDPEFSVIWIHAASVETCAEGLRRLAEKCGIVNTQVKSASDQHFPRAPILELLHTVRTCLGRATARRWLIVFDSADNLDALTAPLIDPRLLLESDDAHNMSIVDCIPKDGFVVFTTKSRTAAAKLSDGNMLEVGRFALEEATQMLEVGLDDDLLMDTPDTTQQRSSKLGFEISPPGEKMSHGVHQHRADRASELAEKLDCLPLAISQATGFMNKNRLSIADYLKRMSASSDEMVAELMTRPQPRAAQIGVPKSIYDTWRLSYEIIRSHNHLAVDVLAFMSFLEQNSITFDLLEAAFCMGPDVNLVDALGELRDYELIHPGFVADTFTIHRLVQVTTKKWLKESKLEVQWARAVLMTIADKFPNSDKISSWPECAAWLLHANEILRCPVFKTPADQDTVATLHLKVGHYYFQTGRWSEARASTEIACNIRTDILGPLETPTLDAKDQFIQIVRQLGQYNLAEATARNVKRYRKRKLGRKNETTLKSYWTLSLTLQDQGQFADATRCVEKAMKGFQDIYGAADSLHPDILYSKYRLGAAYEMMGDFVKSEMLLSEALQGLIQRDEGETRQASLVLFRLSYLQRGLGDYHKSEESAVASMLMRRKLLGLDHPDTTKAFFSSGWSLQCQGRYEESADIFIAVIEVCKQKIGEHHAYTYTASYFLAESLKGLGQFEQAKELHERVLAGRVKALRKHHPGVLTSQVGLASVLLLLGDLERAEELTLEVYKFLKKEGKMSKERAAIAWMCMSNMGELHAKRAVSAESELQRQTQWKEAMKWGQRLVDGQEGIIGPRHPEAIKASQALTGYLNASGKRPTANSTLDTVARLTLANMTLGRYKSS
jgi:tetratricopeptide (TPR) repeat protein